MLQRLREWMGNLTVEKIGLAVAFGLLLATWWQGCLTREALHVTERAYIDVRGIALEPSGIVSVGKFTMVVLIKNAGRTPATITDINITPMFISARSANAEIGEPANFRIPKIPSYSQKSNSVAGLGALPAGETSTEMAAALGLKGEIYGFSPQQVKDIETGKSGFFIYGYVKYSDAFREAHAIGFCGFYDPTRKPPELGMFNGCQQAGYTYAY
jgi:hypothetical protein